MSEEVPKAGELEFGDEGQIGLYAEGRGRHVVSCPKASAMALSVLFG